VTEREHLDCCARVCLLVRAPYLLVVEAGSYRTAHHLRRRERFVPAERIVYHSGQAAHLEVIIHRASRAINREEGRLALYWLLTAQQDV
jgi:hypothetical protein